ncbi:hypothetical protein FPQ18DRAFT_355455 [Pyronema domesticum]|uniref:Similar to Translation initiation factor IF-3 acc. no. Q5WEI6 n=1 Tax=Pyronema omphalodes (strain CBS 100304) TaxID=1076935 RepID=U4LCA2_PYROM|nr:hypothetical protein FPQ18DRAFT_355455 [Pyronema domesticum]CCX12048.1 Similar to Translation initiation factor IF-3; acc. no. Q5WEI6 [Pyronema omphalodes CBS 100304]
MPPRLPTPLLRLLRPATPQLRPLQIRNYALRDRRERVIPSGLSNVRIVDEMIPAQEVHYINANNQFQGIVPLSQILSEIDRSTYQLVCLNPAAKEGPLICKLRTIEDLRAEDREKYSKAGKEKRKAKKPEKIVTKEIEISWAIDSNDLKHRMKKVTEFLDKGWKVELRLGIKKGMAKQALSTMKALLEHVRGICLEHGTEVYDPEGEIGRKYMMTFEGKKKVDKGGDAATKGNAAVEDDAAAEGSATESKEVTKEER